MRLITLLLAILFCSSFVSCRETGTLAACAGSFSGKFAGDKQGVVSGTLSTMGIVIVTLKFEDREVGIEATATSTGAFSGQRGTLSLDGALNLDECSGSGTWTRDGSGTGTWSFEEV
jgi:hypothetical protein